VTAAAVLAVATSVLLNQFTPSIGQTTPASAAAQSAETTPQRPQWAASATGRVEPKDSEIRLIAEVPAKIVEVLAKNNDSVSSGDLLVRLDSDDLDSKLTSAQAEALVREREREEEPVKGLALERRNAEDAVNTSEQAVFAARNALDETYRKSKAGQGDANALTKAREDLKKADEKLAADRATLAQTNAKPDMPLPTRLESSLTAARMDVAQIENAIEKTRVRAPSDGTVLNVWAKLGETAMPSAEASLVLFGDLSSLRVRAEVEERDVPKLRVGQRVVVRADAYPDKDFEGVVTEISQALGPPRITTRGPRRPNDVEVLEVLISLDGKPPLLTGMRVDAFFRNDTQASAAQ
jgi:HlyD family secretion protein